MSELSDDAIGIYHQIFDSSGVRIPFSSFLLALIKHYRAHFSQLGPLGLNKTLCKQGDWFSFSKRHAPSSVCIDDNRSLIDDPCPAVGSFSMADARRLSAHVIKLRDMPEGVLVLSEVDSSLERAVFVIVVFSLFADKGIHDFLCLPEWTEDLVVGTPSVKILAKNEASQKRKASTFGATSSYISLVTPIRSATMIPSSGNQAGALLLPLLKVLTSEGIMVDDAAAPSAGANRPRL
ncbi:hypothetical protein Tco_0646091 [Tanacetum coccineum]